MFYLIEDDKIHHELADWIIRENSTNKRAFAIAKKHGCTHFLLTTCGLEGIVFDKNPGKPWVKYLPNMYPNVYAPHGRLKAAKELREEFNSVKSLSFAEFSKEHLGYKSYFTLNKYSDAPGIDETVDGRYIVSTSAWVTEYEPPEGLREITLKEYKTLVKEAPES